MGRAVQEDREEEGQRDEERARQRESETQRERREPGQEQAAVLCCRLSAGLVDHLWKQ